MKHVIKTERDTPQAVKLQLREKQPQYRRWKAAELKLCFVCLNAFEAIRSDAEYCSPACRKIYSNHARGFSKFVDANRYNPSGANFRIYLRTKGVHLKKRRSPKN